MNRLGKGYQARNWGAFDLLALLGYVCKILVDLALMLSGLIGAVLAAVQGAVLVVLILIFALPACAILFMLR